ncbi:MAG: FKBP-type peptidyl-prolyl cis-trans isomerase N-terminal domain-containing protein [Sphaerochaetaceae bacterium]|jgi:FKBP-type peptidyl-prolyl cis-trans isomerase|nr:FKBP-type peptidyl-prolyl cis-trans isomerase N-terminal domain-containing protein [Sphaerochaetaceae bacterium]
MKKFSLLAVLVLASILIISCTTTKSEVIESVQAPVAEASEVVPVVSDAQTTVVSAPIEQAEPEVIAEAETMVIDTAPPVMATDVDIEQKFAYAYGHLLASNIIRQGLLIDVEQFIRGSSDFYNYTEPLLNEEQINATFVKYQDFLDGNITEADLEDGSEEPIAELPTFFERFSYGYGYIVQFNLQSQGLILDIENFHAGIFDAYNEVVLPYTDEEIDELFMAYQEKLMREYEAMVADYVAMNLAEAEAFLEDNKMLEDVVTTTSGLQYKVIREGEGKTPSETDTVELDYLITFLDGSTGDNSYSRGEPSVFEVSRLIPGFIEGVTLMKEGSHYRFYVHPDLAYGETGNEMVPPNAMLIFDVELYNILD